MNTDIVDLILAGVKWELEEVKTKSETKRKEPKSSETINTKISFSNNHSIVPPIQPLNKDKALAEAESKANISTDIDTLVDAILNFEHPLKQFAKQTVLPSKPTNENSKLLIITDIPSTNDDDSGIILSGEAGDLFDKILTAMGIARENTLICPLLFWRTPGGRTPTGEELEISRPFVLRIIEIFKPRAILTLGTLAKEEIQSFDCDEEIEIFSINHPNYLLLKPEAKKPAWEELQKLLKIL